MGAIEPPQGVGKTAIGVAMVRARESRSEDRLFDDPYAQAFVDAAPGAFSARQQAAAVPADPGQPSGSPQTSGPSLPADPSLPSGSPQTSGPTLPSGSPQPADPTQPSGSTLPADPGQLSDPGQVPGAARAAGFRSLAPMGAVFHARAVIRTRFFDDCLTGAVAAGCGQVVLLAAGLDTRAFRLGFPPATRVFELDLPEVLAFKDAVLAGRGAVAECQRVVVPADLREDWPARLTAAGFDPARPTAWLAEGLLIYLAPAEARRLLTRAGDLSAPGSRISFEHSPGDAIRLATDAGQTPRLKEFTGRWKGGLGDGAPDWLSAHGWRPEFHDIGALATSYGRQLPGRGRGGFLTARRTTQ